MRTYIQSTNFLLWRIIKKGEDMPMKKENEKINEMFERFSKIVNDIHALKKTYRDKELVRKILRSLTPEWCSKADVIQDSTGITNVTIDGLRGNLKTYESTILFPFLGEQKKKGIALKASTSQEPTMEESSDEDNEFRLIIKKFHKFMRKEYERKGKKHGGPPKCYGCGEIGHIKHRAYISWGGDSGDESSEGEENESANLCLMEHEEPPEEVCTISKDSYTFDDVQEAFNELYDEYVNASKINKDLKKQLNSMEKEVDKLSKDNEKLKEENKFFGKRSTDKQEISKCNSCTSLKQQVAKLERTLKKFGVSHKNLNGVLDNLQLTKHGLGKAYRVFNKRTLTVEKSPHVVFAENDTRLVRKVSCDDLVDSLENIYLNDEGNNSKEAQDEEGEPPMNEEQPQEEETPMSRAWRTSKDHPLDKGPLNFSNFRSKPMSVDKQHYVNRLTGFADPSAENLRMSQESAHGQGNNNEHVSVHTEASSFTPPVQNEPVNQQNVGNNPNAGGQPELVIPTFLANVLQQIANAPMFQPPPPPPPRVVTYKTLRDNGAEIFFGDRIAKPQIAWDWIEQTARVLENLNIPIDNYPRLASQLLRKEAYEWWKRTDESAGTPKPWTWAHFEWAFKQEYIPKRFSEERRTEFVELQQGDMTLPEYRQKLTKLANVAPTLVSTPTDRIEEFRKKLRPDLRSRVSVLTTVDFAKAYEIIARADSDLSACIEYLKANNAGSSTHRPTSSASKGKRPFQESSSSHFSKKGKSAQTHSVASESKSKGWKHPLCDTFAGASRGVRRKFHRFSAGIIVSLRSNPVDISSD
ncbi:unnamed protein product [Cuscuta campestris]|uniref:Retrotransposon gag domain-containing protein n=1 Tax=Cuscuta campestris TaxID=132261 RepID=A0A484LI72_9ASTE|nr:unnamed protein product [Cuscuta campestris]